MYLKDKSIRLTLRLNEEQFNYVKKNADVLGVSPSEFLRMVVNATMSLTIKDFTGGAQGRENDESSINHIV